MTPSVSSKGAKRPAKATGDASTCRANATTSTTTLTTTSTRPKRRRVVERSLPPPRETRRARKHRIQNRFVKPGAPPTIPMDVFCYILPKFCDFDTFLALRLTCREAARCIKIWQHPAHLSPKARRRLMNTLASQIPRPIASGDTQDNSSAAVDENHETVFGGGGNPSTPLDGLRLLVEKEKALLTDLWESYPQLPDGCMNLHFMDKDKCTHFYSEFNSKPSKKPKYIPSALGDLVNTGWSDALNPVKDWTKFLVEEPICANAIYANVLWCALTKWKHIPEFATSLLNWRAGSVAFLVFCRAVVEGKLDIMHKLLYEIDEKQQVNPAAQSNLCVRAAAMTGQARAFKILLDVEDERAVDPCVFRNIVFRTACSVGATSIVRQCLALTGNRRIDTTHFKNYSIRLACEGGHVAIVKMLLEPRAGQRAVDTTAEGNTCIRAAACNGHIDVVELLLSLEGRQQVDPSAADNYALRFASLYGHTRVVEMLMDLDPSRGVDPRANGGQALTAALELNDQRMWDALNKYSKTRKTTQLQHKPRRAYSDKQAEIISKQVAKRRMEIRRNLKNRPVYE